MRPFRRIASSALVAVAFTACTSGAPPSSASSGKGSPGGTFTVTFRGETPYFDAATATTLLLPAGGIVTAQGGVRCGIAGGVAATRCVADYPWGRVDAQTLVAVVATPDAGDGYRHFAFAGACSGTGACVVAGNSDAFVAVRFARTREGLGAHPNYSDAAVHGPEYRAFATEQAGALQCTACHGANLLGQGIAPSCAGCHRWPLPTYPALSLDSSVWDRSSWGE